MAGGGGGGVGKQRSNGEGVKYDTHNAGKHKKEVYRGKIRYEVLEYYKKKCKGGKGGTGCTGGTGGDGGPGGNGGRVRFAVADGAYTANGPSTPENDWIKAVCMYNTELDGGDGGEGGDKGKPGAGGPKG